MRAILAVLDHVALLFCLVRTWVDGRTCRNEADVVRVVLRGDDRQVSQEKLIGISLALEELAVVLDVVDAGEDLFEVAQSELLFFEVEDYLQVVFSHHALLALE